jgi:hypothetical protein
MNIKEYYKMCIEDNYLTGFLLVQLLVYDKQALHMTDNVEKIDHYLQPRFQKAMNKELKRMAEKFEYRIQV